MTFMPPRLIFSTLFWLLLALPAPAGPAQPLPGHVPAVTAHLAPVGRLPADQVLKLAVGLPLRHPEELTNRLRQIYDPTSPEFHHYLTPARFAELFGPTERDYQSVAAFARAQGLTVTGTHSNRLVLDVSGSVSNIERAFRVTLRTYAHPRENRQFYAPDAEPAPEVATPLLHVSGLDNYLRPRPMSLHRMPPTGSAGVAPTSGSGPTGAYQGNDFRAAYAPGVALTGTGQSVGLLEFDGYYPGDIATYASLAGVPAVPLKNVYLDGFNGNPGDNNDEVALDIDMAVCMAPGLSAVIVYEGGVADDILNRMATDDLANQLSASWTYGIDAETDQILEEMAAQGQSFFNAAGDDDAYVSAIASPCDDPNLTSVGGTTLTTSGPGGAWVSETVWNWGVEFGTNYDGIGGGGGISTTYAIPGWQTAVSMANNQGSASFRNIPDVSLIADNILLVADEGQVTNVGGTSCAAPLWAAFTALVNQQAAANGRPAAGFLNPALYALGTGADYANCFNDVTTGNNTWSQSPTNYYAVPGYDLCSGWGTPAGGTLINQLAPPDPLQISPAGGFAVAGGLDGPWTPAAEDFVVTNIGNAVLQWACGASVPWLNLSLKGGTLAPGGATSQTVVVSLTAAADHLYLGTYGGTVWFTNLTDGTVRGYVVSLTIIKPPVIMAQPAGLAVVGATTATLTAGASGGLPLNLQWQHDGVNLTNGGRISGAQASLTAGGNLYGSQMSTLTISNVSAADAGTYALVAGNAAGTVVSSNAVLTFIPSKPVILQQPVSEIVMVGAVVQMSVVAIGAAPFTYQWLQNNTNLADGGAVAGSSTPVLTISGASSASIGTYVVVVSNALGSATSTGAVLSVEVAELGRRLVQNGGFETGDFTGWSTTGNFTDCAVSGSAPAVNSGQYGALLGPAGSLGYLSQTVPTVPGQTYLLSLWLDSPDGLGPNEFLAAWNGTVIFDQTNLSALGWTNLQFYVQATVPGTVLEFGLRDDASFLGLDDIQLTPLASAGGPPIIVTQPASQAVFAGGAANFAVLSAGRLPLTYHWRWNGTNLPGATNATLALTNLTAGQSGAYSVVVSNLLGSAASSNAPLTVLAGGPVVIALDDLTGSQLPMPTNYDNLTWSNFNYLDGLIYDPSGFAVGTISNSNVAYNAYGAPAAISAPMPFDLLSAWLTAAWNDNLQVELKGYNGATLAYDNFYTLNATNPVLISFNYLGVTAVEFISAGGTPQPGYGGSGEEFVMDNLNVFFPPDPPVITGQPGGEIVPVGSAAVFTVAATGTAPLSYSWNRNGAPIPGANAASYTNNQVQYSDYGSRYSCLVSNASGTALSANALLTVTPPSLVQNGGFETGGFDDWTTGGNFADCTVTMTAPYVCSGQYGAELGPVGSPAYLSQTLPTTVGQSYLVSCWLYGSVQIPNLFSVSWNGAYLFNQQYLGDLLWTNLQFQVTAAVTNTVLAFGFRNDLSYFGLDDIAVCSLTPPPPQIQSVTLTNGSLTLSWGALSNQLYQVQTTTNLAQGVWINWGAPLATTNASLTITDTNTGSGAQFYRLLLPP